MAESNNQSLSEYLSAVYEAALKLSAGWMGWNLPVLAFLALILSIASQAGDLAESAVKRAVGIKDSSNLIPGHGGLLDRFDALMGASMAATIFGLASYVH